MKKNYEIVQDIVQLYFPILPVMIIHFFQFALFLEQEIYLYMEYEIHICMLIVPDLVFNNSYSDIVGTALAHPLVLIKMTII